MKTLAKIFLFMVNFTLILLALSACQPNNKEAVVSGNNVCVADPTCKPSSGYNGAVYQNYPGYTPYGYGQPFNYYNNSAYLCNCPYGSIPTFNRFAGLGCVRMSHFSMSSNFSAFFYLSWGQNQWTNLPQLYRYNYNSGAGYCYNGVVQSCLVSQPNNCAVGYICRPNNMVSHSASNMGLCVASPR